MDQTEKTYTLEQCIDFVGLGKYQWRLIAILGFCSMADGIEMMLLAILGPALTCAWPTVTQFQIASLSTVSFFHIRHFHLDHVSCFDPTRVSLPG